ncbi:FKBP-type peptidyl-prolyl cis-trans isomerase [bacterium SCSIO 12741]|nr:FKBP-type peptidyl-prolyl cis-trans isomerase [bacterium SCSIO 12741]
MIFRFLLGLFLALSLTSCDPLRWDGYSVTDSGVYYKLHYPGDGERKAQPGDRVYAQLLVLTESDSVVYDNRMQTGDLLDLTLIKNSGGGLGEALSLLHEGDSATFLFPTENTSLSDLLGLENLPKEGRAKVSIQLNKLIPPAGKQHLTGPDPEMEEMKVMMAYLKEEEISSENHVQDVYILPIKPGKGNRAQSGQQVRIAYKGYFLDGTLFDDSWASYKALDFQLGKPDQVIRGIEIALHQMRKGEEVRLIIPYYLAFGQEGSSTGIVPPYTTVIYEVKLISVQ